MSDSATHLHDPEVDALKFDQERPAMKSPLKQVQIQVWHESSDEDEEALSGQFRSPVRRNTTRASVGIKRIDSKNNTFSKDDPFNLSMQMVDEDE